MAQRPVYYITGKLNSFSTDTLRGTIDITWTNNSNTVLKELGIHLWPNAYRNTETDFAKQFLEEGNIEMHRASPSDFGGIYDLDFFSTGQKLNLEIDTNNIDIGWLQLNEPLAPGASVRFSSPYTLIIPKSFSRIGRTGDAYQLTQWYPHIAVYDEQGWHTMPYLNNGEYYNDFADYEVVLTLPNRYKVAATGTLISTKENTETTEFIFQATNVIDFAWFASPTFRHETLKVDVGRSEPVELNMYIDSWSNENWKSAILLAERAVKFYSDWLGPYPYPQISVAYTPYSAAGYMEYPMVAQISYTADPVMLDRVIAHEIGHTWLYGILASNERTNPWLDEGFNSFLEEEYMKANHQDPVQLVFPGVLSSKNSMSHYDALQHMIRFNGELQPPQTPPDHQTNNQYLYSAYSLPQQGLSMIMSMVGPEKMKLMMRKYYEDHKFTHVDPSDVKASFESVCECDLKWFFEDWIHHAHELDYRLKKFDSRLNNVTIENRGPSEIPVLISGYQDNKEVTKRWVNGFSGQKEIHLDRNVDEVRLYDGLMAPNKIWRGNVKPRDIIPSIGILPKIGSYTKPQIDLTPVVGKNQADGFMAGVALTSGLMPQQGMKWFLMPMYGFESKKLRYYGEARYTKDLDTKTFDHLLLSFAASSFGYNLDTHYLYRDEFLRFSPSLGLRMNSSFGNPKLTGWWKYRYVDITQNYNRGINYEEKIYESEQRHYGIHELEYQLSSDNALRPFTASANLQVGSGFVRINLNYDQHFVGQDKGRGIWVHGFAGFLPVYDQPKANVAFTFNGIGSNGFFSKDYMYDEWLGGRNVNDGLLSRQIFMKDARLKTLSTVGVGEEWMIGGGISAALPFKFVHVYMDATLFPSAITSEVQLSYSGGFSVILLKDVLEVYVPLMESKDIRESLSYEVRDMWFDRISFQANIKLANPLNIVDHYQLKY